MTPGDDKFHVAVKAALFDAMKDVREEILGDVDDRVTQELATFQANQDKEHAKTRAFVAVASIPSWGKTAAGVVGTIGFASFGHFFGLGTWLVSLF